MIASQYAPPLDDLELAWEVTSDVFVEGDRTTRMHALCLMACIVSKYPRGRLQDLAEDMLSTFISEARPSPDDLELIRYFRASEA